jgi:hypothetical protein
MRKLVLLTIALCLSAAALAGCRASGEIDPHGSTFVSMPR